MKIKNINVNFVQYGKKGAQDVVLLHGWGCSTKTMDPIAQGLKNDFYLTLIDLPGFGNSDEINEEYITINDYYEIIKELLSKLKIKNPILIGHSFGGKLAIIYSSKEKVKKLILTGAPFRASQKKPSFKMKVIKAGAKIPGLKGLAEKMKSKMGSIDYQSASPNMRKVLINSVSTDLTENLKNIKAPTLLIWGSLDTAVSLEDAFLAEKLIPDAGLVVYENEDHYAYLHEIARTNLIINKFLESDKE